MFTKRRLKSCPDAQLPSAKALLMDFCRSRNLSPNTMQIYGNRLEAFIGHVAAELGQVAVTDITAGILIPRRRPIAHRSERSDAGMVVGQMRVVLNVHHSFRCKSITDLPGGDYWFSAR